MTGADPCTVRPVPAEALDDTDSNIWDGSGGGLLGQDRFGLTEPAELIAGLLLAVMVEGTDRWQEIVADAVGILVTTLKGARAYGIAGEEGDVWSVCDLDALAATIRHATYESHCNRLVRALLNSHPASLPTPAA